jgi:hypothetical protein
MILPITPRCAAPYGATHVPLYGSLHTQPSGQGYPLPGPQPPPQVPGSSAMHVPLYNSLQTQPSGQVYPRSNLQPPPQVPDSSASHVPSNQLEQTQPSGQGGYSWYGPQ